jgi:hypothetical protein
MLRHEDDLRSFLGARELRRDAGFICRAPDAGHAALHERDPASGIGLEFF